MKMPCDRAKCSNLAPDGDLYCSIACFDLDNDPAPIQPIARNKADGFGLEISRMRPQSVAISHPASSSTDSRQDTSASRS
jgi:hypothetical protein